MCSIWEDILAHAHLISLVNPDVSGKKDFNTFYSITFSGSQPMLSWTLKKSSRMLFPVLGIVSQRHLLITMLVPKKGFRALFYECITVAFRIKICL